MAEDRGTILTDESIGNFRVAPNDAILCGIIALENNWPAAIHLAIIGNNIPNNSKSWILGQRIEGLTSGGGAHAELLDLVMPGQAQQLGPGIATGPGRGFTIQKLGTYSVQIARRFENGVEVETGWRSGLNSQGGPTRELANEFRSWIEDALDRLRTQDPPSFIEIIEEIDVSQ
jgi:hypothetical protein